MQTSKSVSRSQRQVTPERKFTGSPNKFKKVSASKHEDPYIDCEYQVKLMSQL
jgi:hypothetical protein